MLSTTTTVPPGSFLLLQPQEDVVQPTAEGFDFSETENLKEEGTVEEIRQRRKETLACAFRIFAHNSLGVGVVGHLTVRDPEFPDRFWVNPFQKAFSCLTASDLIMIDHEGNVVFTSPGRTSVYNRAAFVIHAKVHSARPDVLAVCHSHSIYGSSFSSFGRLPDFITQDSLQFYQSCAVYPAFGGVVLAAEEADEIARYLGSNKAVILQNHGLLTVGESIESAAYWFLALEKVCQMQLLIDAAASGSGHRPVVIGEQESRFTAAETGKEASGRFHFSPYREEIDRLTGGDYKL